MLLLLNPVAKKRLCCLQMQGCGLNAYLFKIGLHDTGLCDNFGVPETVEHFVIQCQNNISLLSDLREIASDMNITCNLTNYLSVPKM
jgi:hypothetical protein